MFQLTYTLPRRESVTETFNTQAELFQALDDHGIPRRYRSAGSHTFKGERYEWCEVADATPAVEITAGQKYRSAHRNVVMTVVKPSNGKYGVHVDPSDDPGHVGAYELGVFEKMVADGDMILIENTPTIKVTLAGARILRRFITDARKAELNNGTLIFGGTESAAARKLVRDGLLERIRESIAYRLTDAGRTWLAANSAAYRMANPAPVVEVTPITSTTAESLALLQGVSDAQDLAGARAAEPQYVTVEGEPGTGLRWHLCDGDGQPVEAGEYTAKWSGRPRFKLAEHPEIYGWTTDGVPRCVWVEWVDVTRGYCEPGELVDGWHWEAERV